MKAKQLLVDNNLHNTHWGKRIIDAENRGEFTNKDKTDAGSWVTCACGQHSNDIVFVKDEHDVLGYPEDSHLYMYGIDFSDVVIMSHASDTNPYIEAAETLIEIEKRVIELLTDESNENNQRNNTDM